MLLKFLAGLVLLSLTGFIIHIIFLVQGAESPLWNTTYCKARNFLDIQPSNKCDGGEKDYILRCRILVCLRDYEITEEDPTLSIN